MKQTSRQRLSSHRAGHCAQHYHLIRLDWIGAVTGRVHSTHFDKVTAQFFVLDKHSAQIVVTDHNAISRGALAQEEMKMPSVAQVAAIAYSITACAKGRTLESEDFIHKLKEFVSLESWKLSSRGPLWTWRPLNDLLDQKVFGSVKGAQFLA